MACLTRRSDRWLSGSSGSGNGGRDSTLEVWTPRMRLGCGVGGVPTLQALSPSKTLSVDLIMQNGWVFYLSRPSDSDPPQAQDLLNFVIILPSWVQEAVVVLNNPQSLRRTLGRGMNTLTTPFVPGQVAFELRVPTKQPDGTATEVTLLRGTGREIEAEPKAFNFNMWSGSWQLVSRP